MDKFLSQKSNAYSSDNNLHGTNKNSMHHAVPFLLLPISAKLLEALSSTPDNHTAPFDKHSLLTIFDPISSAILSAVATTELAC